ncbi:putative glycosyltransferase [Leptolyngbya sp. PCC 7375]|nr:putative glycosyltransferase [Leptolyngbya sp. PCC 7375]
MKLSVVIPCFNVSDTLGAQLDALVQQQWDKLWETIIVDNGSTDRTLEIARDYMERLPHLRIIEAYERKGAAYARNQGVSAAASESIAFCDADDEVASGWVAAMGTALEKYDLVGGGCELKKLNPSWVIKSRLGGQEREMLADGLLHSKLSPDYPYTASCNLGIKREVHEKIGGFDETLFTCEDFEYCRQAQLQGSGIKYIPEAIVHYRLRHSLVGIYKQAYSYAHCQVFLYERYKAIGMSPRPLSKSVMAWRLLIKGLLQIRSKADLAVWFFSFGWRVGHEAGKKQYLIHAGVEQ